MHHQQEKDQVKESFYATTPIYYVNAQPHLGTAYSTLLTDARARFERMDGKDVFFLTGMDEHGQKVAQSAEEHNLSPQEWCDSMVPAFKDLWKELDITNDDFIRTTQPRHERGVQAFLEDLKDRGYIYKSQYDGWYCVPDETYFTETQVRHYNEEAGDAEAHNCPDCGRPLVRVQEESWFFKLSEFQDKLLELYETRPDFIQPEIRRNEVISFVQGGLKDLSISRTTFDWGIPLTFDPEHVTYVWVDALLNYLTAVGYGDADKTAELSKRWPAQMHLIGKDIIRFHCVIWPAMLMAAGLEVPNQVFVHGFLLTKGQKMSKSRGNAIAPRDLVDIFGLDAYRYYFLTDVQPGADGSISMERMVQVYNADLANSWGNLCSRALNMSAKYFEGKTPTVTAEALETSSPLKEVAQGIYDRYASAIRTMNYQEAARVVLELVAEANLYIEESAPWNLAKSEETAEELARVIYNVLEAIRIVAYLFMPFMPRTSQEVLRRMSISAEDENITLKDAVQWGQLLQNVEVTKGEALFPRLDMDKITIDAE